MELRHPRLEHTTPTAISKKRPPSRCLNTSPPVARYLLSLAKPPISLRGSVVVGRPNTTHTSYHLPTSNPDLSLPRTFRGNFFFQVVRDEYPRCANGAHCHGHIQPGPRGKHCREHEHNVNRCTQSTLPLYDSHNVRLRADGGEYADC